MREIVCEIKNNYRQFHLRGRSARCSAAAPREGRAGSGARRGPDHPGWGQAHRAPPPTPPSSQTPREDVGGCWRAAGASRVFPPGAGKQPRMRPLWWRTWGALSPQVSSPRAPGHRSRLRVNVSPPPRSHPGPPGSKAPSLRLYQGRTPLSPRHLVLSPMTWLIFPLSGLFPQHRASPFHQPVEAGTLPSPSCSLQHLEPPLT